MFAVLATLLSIVAAFTPNLLTYPQEGDVIHIGESFDITWVQDPHWFSPFITIYMPDGDVFDLFFGGGSQSKNYRFPSYAPLGTYTMNIVFLLGSANTTFTLEGALPSSTSSAAVVSSTSAVTSSVYVAPTETPITTSSEAIVSSVATTSSEVVVSSAAATTSEIAPSSEVVNSTVAVPSSSEVTVTSEIASTTEVSTTTVAATSSVPSSSVGNTTIVTPVQPTYVFNTTSAPNSTHITTGSRLGTFTITTYGNTYTITTYVPNAGSVSSWSKYALFGAIAGYALLWA